MDSENTTQEMESPQSNEITLKIKSLHGEQLELQASPNLTVNELKQIIHNQKQLEPSKQRLIFMGKVLKDEHTLDYYKIQHNSVLHLVANGRPPRENEEQPQTTPSTQPSVNPPNVNMPQNVPPEVMAIATAVTDAIPMLLNPPPVASNPSQPHIQAVRLQIPANNGPIVFGGQVSDNQLPNALLQNLQNTFRMAFGPPQQPPQQSPPPTHSQPSPSQEDPVVPLPDGTTPPSTPQPQPHPAQPQQPPLTQPNVPRVQGPFMLNLGNFGLPVPPGANITIHAPGMPPGMAPPVAANVASQPQHGSLEQQLDQAVVGGDLTRLRQLWEQRGNTPISLNAGLLHKACVFDHPDIVDYLIQNGAAVDAKLANGETPLHTCCMYGHPHLAEKLLALNPATLYDRMNDGKSCLLLAVFNNHRTVVELLLNKGLPVNENDVNGTTPLLMAAQRGNKEIVELLLKNKADVNARDTKGRTALHFASSGGHPSILSLLLNNGAQVNAINCNKETALHYAAFHGKRECALFLLSKGADFTIESKSGTPLQLARARNQVEVAQILVQYGATR